MLPASPTPTWTQARARIAGLIARGAAADDPRVQKARADLVAALRASELDRAIDDPATLARAARIVAAAIARHRLTLAAADDDEDGAA